LYLKVIGIFTFLPIVQQGPDKLKKPDDNFGLACISIFINPIFGIIAVLLAGKLTDILHVSADKLHTFLCILSICMQGQALKNIGLM
jgi:hypothetical protein